MNLNIVRPNLASYQHEFLYNDARFTITESSTKAGKTFAHIWWIYERAHEHWNRSNYNHWWVAPVSSQSKIAFTRLKIKLERTGLYKINESNMTITCPNGAMIHFKSADKPDSLYGEDVYSVVFDEAPRGKVAAYYALRSTITATRGVMKMIGNFGGVSNWMHQLKEKSKTDSQYAYYKVTAWDAVEAGILQREEIEQAQRDLPPKIFKQLYLAEEQESLDQLISFEAMRDMFTNTHAERGMKYITADIALHGSDKYVVFVWDGWVVIDYLIMNKTTAPEVEQTLKSIAEKHNVGRSNITYDADGLGSFLRGYLQGASPFVNGSKPHEGNYKNLKSECGYKFAKRVNNREIGIECDIDKTLLFRELECLQSYALDNEGKMQLLPKSKVKEVIGHSPDMLDALMMRMYFDKPIGEYHIW